MTIFPFSSRGLLLYSPYHNHIYISLDVCSNRCVPDYSLSLFLARKLNSEEMCMESGGCGDSL